MSVLDRQSSSTTTSMPPPALLQPLNQQKPQPERRPLRLTASALLLACTIFFSSATTLASADEDIFFDIESDNDNDDIAANIIGGSPAASYPGHAVTDQSNNLLCGASLIAPDMLVTAAHCRGTFEGGLVYIGSTRLSGSDAQDTVRVTEEFVHPDYNTGNNANDIMLLKLQRTTAVTPMVYNTDAGVPRTGSAVVAVGFGATNPDNTGSFASTLLQVTLTVLPSSNCAGRSTAQVVCGGAPSNTNVASTCAGDSGSPLVAGSGSNLIYGLNSFGIRNGSNNCQDDSPTGFTRLSTHASWIAELVCAQSNAPPCSCPGAPANCSDGGDGGDPTGGTETTGEVASLFGQLLRGILNFLLDLLGVDPI